MKTEKMKNIGEIKNNFSLKNLKLFSSKFLPTSKKDLAFEEWQRLESHKSKAGTSSLTLPFERVF